ncbi:MAG: hypothetical protein AAB035_03595 [Nitrospirota bacterium]
MDKKILVAIGMGLALTFGAVEKSEAWCFFGCPDVEVDTNVATSDGSTDSNTVAGNGNTSASNLRNSTVVGGNMSSNSSNSIGAIGSNRGDISQSNTQSITSGTTNLQGNDFRDQSNRGNR